MFEATLEIELLSDWHVGTGQGAGPLLDAQVFRTPAGLPCIPGRTLKGLLREAVEAAEHAGLYETNERSTRWFGSGIPKPGDHSTVPDDERRFHTEQGALSVSDARIGATTAQADAWERWAAQEKSKTELAALYRSFASTSVGEDGIVAEKTLRSIEAVIPLTLHARIRGDESALKELSDALVFFDGVGSHRTRGFGRCRARVTAVTPLAAPPAPGEPGQQGGGPQTIHCSYTLETDVAVTERAATVGGHRSLAFLPGSAILGAVAKGLYADDEAWTRANDWELFFSGHVRFGNATIDGASPVPLSWHRKKGEKDGSILDLASAERPPGQWEPMRGQWVDSARTLRVVKLRASMRTAIGASGRARDGYLYDIEAIERGQRFEGSITIDTGDRTRDAEIARRIRAVLSRGPLEVGKSSRQEFGRVSVSEREPSQHFGESVVSERTDTLRFLCVSDLLLIDAVGQSTFAPEARHFGLSDEWKYDAKRSFVRTRSWTPFRVRRSTTSELAKTYKQRPATERHALVAGSVIVFKRDESAPVDVAALRARLRAGVGLHTSEGLGVVELEPALLAKSEFSLSSLPIETVDDGAIAREPAELVRWLERMARRRQAELRAWEIAEPKLALFARTKLTAAQWGGLRAELRRIGPSTKLAEELTRYLRPPQSEGTKGPRGGVGQRALQWERERIGGASVAEHLVKLATSDEVAPDDSDPVLVRWLALLQLAQWVPVKRRMREGGRS
jgi:CRISPR/Cas system CSM-associated protein Csm3 (group 7 of RAMP superfamily)